MSEGNVLSFAQKLAEAQQRLGNPAPAVPVNPAQAQPAQPASTTSTTPVSPAAPAIPEEDIPEVELNLSAEDEALDNAIKNLGIVEAYAKWCAKMTPKVGNKREGIMISCPDPNHPDVNPSAWMNLDKNTYYCPGCAYGGDVWDIAALAYGFAVPGYKQDPSSFRKLREMMGLDLGFSIVKGYSGTHIIPPVAEGDEQSGSAGTAQAEASPSTVEAPAPSEADAAPEELPAQGNSVGKLPGAVEQEQDEETWLSTRDAPSIDWRAIIPEETFLRSWMDSTTKDNSPEEYHLWTGLMALGFAVGRKKMLWDLPNVIGNLFVCLVGPSGAGKSKASRHLKTIIDLVLRWDQGTFSGVKAIKQPGSAEYLITAFTANEEDPSNPGVVIQHPVRGLVEFNEMSVLAGIGGRSGSVLKPQLMDIYDAADEISGGSLTHGYRSAREPFGQCFTTTQNNSLSRLLDRGDDDSGFMNRWVFVQGPMKPPIAIGGVRVDLTDPAQMLSAIHTWSHMGSNEIQWSEPAAKLWTEFFLNTLHPTKEQAEKNGSAMLNRLDLLMKKLILLFTVNVMSSVVPKAAVEQAIALYPYLLATFGVVSNQLSKTEDSDNVDRVLSAIRKLTDANKMAPTRRDIYQSVRRHFKSTKQLEDLLKSLVGLEVLVEVAAQRKPGQRGQLGVRYAIAN